MGLSRLSMTLNQYGDKSFMFSPTYHITREEEMINLRVADAMWQLACANEALSKADASHTEATIIYNTLA